MNQKTRSLRVRAIGIKAQRQRSILPITVQSSKGGTKSWPQAQHLEGCVDFSRRSSVKFEEGNERSEFKRKGLGMVAQVCNPSTEAAEAGGS